MNDNEITYVAAFAAEAMYPTEGFRDRVWRPVASRMMAAGLLALQRAGWTFTYTEPQEK